MAFVRSLLFSLAMAVLTLIMAPVTLLLRPFPFAVRYGFTRYWAVINLRLLALLCGLRYLVEGREHIPAKASVVLCKHQSAWETLALQEIFPPQVWVLKRELLRLPFFGWALGALEPIAIDRKSGRKAMDQVVEQGSARLAAGRWVVVFPEGTRVAPGETGKYRVGGALLAVRSGRPVVPVAHNAGEFWPRHGFIKRPGTIRLVIGPAIATAGRTPEEVLAEAQGWIEGTMRRISGVAYQN